MTTDREVLDHVRQALASEPHLHQDAGAIRLALSGGALTMEGEVGRVAAKKLALEAAARCSGVAGIVDRLRVRPAGAMGDGAIRDAVRDSLLGEVVLERNAVIVRAKGASEVVRDPPGATGRIEVTVEDGVVTLDGEVAGLGEKRMAGVLAWWVSGSRDVVNGLGVSPPERDSDEAITDAVRQVLEKDPVAEAGSIVVTVRKAWVTLDGVVPNEEAARAAEDDAWCVFGVDGVDNRLIVRP